MNKTAAESRTFTCVGYVLLCEKAVCGKQTGRNERKVDFAVRVAQGQSDNRPVTTNVDIILVRLIKSHLPSNVCGVLMAESLISSGIFDLLGVICYFSSRDSNIRQERLALLVIGPILRTSPFCVGLGLPIFSK